MTIVKMRYTMPDFQVIQGVASASVAMPGGAPAGPNSYWWVIPVTAKVPQGTPVATNNLEERDPRAQRLQQLVTNGIEIFVYLPLGNAQTAQTLYLYAQNTSTLIWYTASSISVLASGVQIAGLYLTGLPAGSYNVYLGTSLAASTATSSAPSIYSEFPMFGGATLTGIGIYPTVLGTGNPYTVIVNDTVLDTRTNISYYSAAGFWNVSNFFMQIPGLFSGQIAAGISSFAILSTAGGSPVGFPSLVKGVLRYLDIETVCVVAPIGAIQANTSAGYSRYAILGGPGSFKVNANYVTNGTAIPCPIGDRIQMGAEICVPITEVEQFLPVEALSYVSLPIFIVSVIMTVDLE